MKKIRILKMILPGLVFLGLAYTLQAQAPVVDYSFTRNLDDSGPFDNHASNSGATLDADRFDYSNHAYYFDGIDDGITAENLDALNSPNTTISFWVKVASLPAQGEVFIASFGNWKDRWKISMPSHGKPVFTTNTSSGIQDMDSDSLPTEIGVWSHWVMVHDGTTNYIYKDGVLANTRDSEGPLNSTATPLGIGFEPVDAALYFHGSLDEFQIFDVALSAEQIATLYSEQSTAITYSDQEAPTQPADFSGTVQNLSIDLSWSASADNVAVDLYNVYLNNIKTATTAGLSYSLTDLEPLTEYLIQLSASDSSGNESTLAEVNLTTGDIAPDTTAPTTPTNLTIAAGPNSVVLSWEPSTDDRELQGYLIYVDGSLTDTVSSSRTSTLITGLSPETFYTFEVQALDASGNTSELAEITESTTAPLVTAEEGLVAHYPFDGNADDATPYANHGAIGGDVTFIDVDDRATGQAILFDGDRDSVLVPNAAQLNSDYATVSFWIRLDSINTSDAEAYILDFGHWDQRWKVSLPTHRKIVWTTNSNNSISEGHIKDMDAGDGFELVESFWFFVTMVHDAENNYIYIDGEETNSIPAPGELNTTSRALGIGNNNVDGGQYFIGALDELKIYNRALTADEISKLFTNGTTPIFSTKADVSKYVQSAFPNPAIDIIKFEHSFDPQSNVLVRVFDNSGRQVHHQQLSSAELQSQLFSIDLSEMATGHYIANFVVNGKNQGSLPFIKLK